ncbi:MAG: immunoglobulin domain-containing protein, partial [Planctomycetes bacterium]|nr:immunoglobulin domain-containing protein [Planctomycetota bacterium]
YTVVVSNVCNPTGVESPAGDLTVHERTQLGAIALDPPGQPVDCGVSVTLSAPVTGTPAPDLQWYLEGRLILGATSDALVIDSVVPSDQGNYILQATNAVACQVGEDDDIVETAPFFLDIDENDPTCLGGAPFVKSALTPQDHGGQTLYIGIVLDHGAGDPTTESRIGGVHTLEIMFDQAMAPVTTQDTTNISVIGVNSGTIASGDMLATLDANGTLQTLTFPGLTGGRLANQDRYTIELSTTIESAGPGGLPLAGDRNFDVRGLEADVNGDGTVDPLDSGAILARFGLPVAPKNVEFDINTDGDINPLDSGAALARFGNSAP